MCGDASPARSWPNKRLLRTRKKTRAAEPQAFGLSVSMYDFHFDRELGRDELRAALSRVFALAEHKVVVADDEENLPAALEDALGCVVRKDHGEFCEHVACYPGDSLRGVSEVELAKSLTAIFHCRCLVSDDSVNPFRWLLVEAGGTASVVNVDTHALEDDELTIDPRHNAIGSD